ncbi:MAG: CobW-related selenoprotein, partial [Desulfatirhabdiaceae bacterium]
LWEERSFLMMGHIRQADRIAVTHADLLDEERMHHIRDVLKTDVGDLLPLSVPRDQGVEKIIAAIVNRP